MCICIKTYSIQIDRDTNSHANCRNAHAAQVPLRSPRGSATRGTYI